LSFKRISILLLSSYIILTFCKLVLAGRSYLFKGSYTGVVDTIINYRDFVIVVNNSFKPITIVAKTKIGILNEYKEDEYYLLEPLVESTIIEILMAIVDD
jgi:hypothetical protein